MNSADQVRLEKPNIISGLTYKYILLHVPGGGGYQWCVRFKEPPHSHQHILTNAEEEFKAIGLSVRCMGGGLICFDLENRSAVIFGKSTELGSEYDRELTASVVRGVMFGFSIEIKD